MKKKRPPTKASTPVLRTTLDECPLIVCQVDGRPRTLTILGDQLFYRVLALDVDTGEVFSLPGVPGFPRPEFERTNA